MKKIYLSPKVEDYIVATQQMIAESDEIHGGGPGNPSAKLTIFDITDDDSDANYVNIGFDVYEE